MEKYGVSEEEPANKTASEETACPDCGSPLRPVETTGVLMCPRCGTKPFEKKAGS